MRRQWRKFALTPMLILLMVGCATTPRGKAQQAGRILIAIDRAAIDACTLSKQQADPVTGAWQPLSEGTCRDLYAAYDLAFTALKQSLEALREDPNARVGHITARVLWFVFTAVDVLGEHKITVPSEVQAFVHGVRKEL